MEEEKASPWASRLTQRDQNEAVSVCAFMSGSSGGLFAPCECVCFPVFLCWFNMSLYVQRCSRDRKKLP